MCKEMEERILTIKDDLIAGTLESLRMANRKAGKLMDDYKGQLFWLDLSFIGWHILALATAGIGYLWLSPYISATKAAFYEQLPKDI